FVAALLCGVCAGLLAAGRFPFLDRVIKLVMVLLAASTLAAAAHMSPGPNALRKLVFEVPVAMPQANALDHGACVRQARHRAKS
ncbi:MAG: hypothetical protein KJO44_04530, partial [Gemmatimonadetes bacterium]|nr:hypothetical protein [Gemmatimonadota bacterium]